MKTSLLSLFLFLATSSLAAQAVSVTVSAATALTTRASAGGTNDVQTLAIGPLPASGGLLAQASVFPAGPSALMNFGWQTTLPSQYERLTFGCGWLGWANANPGPASAGVDPFEMLFQLQAPTPRWVLVAGHVDIAVPPGQPAPQLECDLFDDGAAEWSTTGATLPIPVLVGPTPVPIRVRGAASVSSGTAQAVARIDVTPDNRIGIQPLMQGCLSDSWLRLEQAFAHDGVRMRVPSGALCVGVLGLGVQPLLLSTYSSFPCLLLPSPDVLLVVPANGYDLPIPASVRPVDFYAQAVWFEGQSLPTTTGYRVSAY